jgi:hypothetical protein
MLFEFTRADKLAMRSAMEWAPTGVRHICWFCSTTQHGSGQRTPSFITSDPICCTDCRSALRCRARNSKTGNDATQRADRADRSAGFMPRLGGLQTLNPA